jgi:hypothetical protein
MSRKLNLQIEDMHSWLDISCPEVFERTDFRKWLARMAGHGLATWHHAGQETPGEYSDVFVIYDHDEGPDAPTGNTPETGMPQPVWNAVCKICKAAGVGYAIVRLKNC